MNRHERRKEIATNGPRAEEARAESEAKRNAHFSRAAITMRGAAGTRKQRRATRTK